MPDVKRPTLEEMQARNLPRCTAADIFSGLDTVGQTERAALDEYLSDFLPPSKGCVCCDTAQAGLMGILCGGFTWGLIHGEGFCATCHWPGRAYHRPKDGPLEHFSFVLQYHPGVLARASSDGEAAWEGR